MHLSNSFRFVLVVLVLLILSATTESRAQVFPLELMIEDVETFADGEVSIVVRTLEDRPLASAAFAIEVRERDGLPILPFAGLVSTTGTLNVDYGPLLVLRFQLTSGLQDRQRFEMRMDPDVTLRAPDLSPVVSLAGKGRLRITEPEPGAGLSGFGGETFPGAQVVFGAATAMPFPIGGGTVEFLYDPAFTDGTQPVVKIDTRYGAGVITSVTEPVPGRLIVEFVSPDGTLNATFPGMFLTASVPSLDTIVQPTTFPFSFGPATALVDTDGAPIEPREAEADPTEFLVTELLFGEGLDGGDLLEWWDVVG